MCVCYDHVILSYSENAGKEPAFVPGWVSGLIIKIDYFHFNLHVLRHALFDGNALSGVDHPLGQPTGQSSFTATVSFLEKKNEVIVSIIDNRGLRQDLSSSPTPSLHHKRTFDLSAIKCNISWLTGLWQVSSSGRFEHPCRKNKNWTLWHWIWRVCRWTWCIQGWKEQWNDKNRSTGHTSDLLRSLFADSISFDEQDELKVHIQPQDVLHKLKTRLDEILLLLLFNWKLMSSTFNCFMLYKVVPTFETWMKY